MAASDTIEFYRGESVLLTFTMDPVVDITGWQIKFTAAKTTERKDKKIDPITATVVDGPTGVFTVLIERDKTVDLRSGDYYYDAWRTNSGAERVLAVGTLNLLPEVAIPEEA